MDGRNGGWQRLGALRAHGGCDGERTVDFDEAARSGRTMLVTARNDFEASNAKDNLI
jgi:hypothetical protein